MPDQYWLRCQELVYADQTDPSNMPQAGVKVFSMRVLVLTPLAAGSDPDFAHVGNAAELPKPWNLLLLGESSQEVPVKVSRIIQNSPDLQAFFLSHTPANDLRHAGMDAVLVLGCLGSE